MPDTELDRLREEEAKAKRLIWNAGIAVLGVGPHLDSYRDAVRAVAKEEARAEVAAELYAENQAAIAGPFENTDIIVD